MCGFLLRIIFNALVMLFVIANLPGIFVDTLGSTILGATIMGLVNAAVRPVMSYLSQLQNQLALGSITFVANIFTPMVIFRAIPGFQISNVLTPLIGIILMSICSFSLSKFIKDR